MVADKINRSMIQKQKKTKKNKKKNNQVPSIYQVPGPSLSSFMYHLIESSTKSSMMAHKIQYHKDVNSPQIKPIKTELIPPKIPTKYFIELEN